MANIHKGDIVQVISGPSQARGGDRGKQGEVIEVQVEKNRVVVQGINFVTKHVRVGQTDRGTKTGGIETREAPIHVSNVQLVDPSTKQPARVGFKVETGKNGKPTRVRYFKPSRRAAKPAKAKASTTTKAKAAPADEASSAEKPSKINTEESE